MHKLLCYDSYYGSQAMAMFLFSDILGDHRITLGTEMQIDFRVRLFIL